MGKRKLGKIVTRPGRRHGDQAINFPVAADLLKVEGVPTRNDEVSYYSREFPMDSFSSEQSASAIWADNQRSQHSPKTAELYRNYQKQISPWVQKILQISKENPTNLPSGQDPTEPIREKARSLGYGEVGFTRFDRRYIYHNRIDDVRTDLPNAICLALEQDYKKTQKIPSLDSEIAQGESYMKQAELALGLAEFLITLGYRAQISGPVWFFGPVIPMFVECGLGQLGINGQLLSPHFGSRARLQIIITDAPLRHDAPVDYGIHKFCELCQICFMRCPGKAIQAQRVWFRGVEKNKLIHERCRPVMSRYSGCGVCMKVCPIQKYGMKSVMEHYVEKGEILGKSSEDLEGYELPGKGYFGPGKTPKFDREFFNMPSGRAEMVALTEVRDKLSSTGSLSDSDKDKIWLEFRAKIEEIESAKGKIVDMGMDMDI